MKRANSVDESQKWQLKTYLDGDLIYTMHFGTVEEAAHCKEAMEDSIENGVSGYYHFEVVPNAKTPAEILLDWL